MIVVVKPPRKDWQNLAKRPTFAKAKLDTIVTDVFEAVSRNSDSAVREYTVQFDKVSIDSLVMSQSEIDACATKTPQDLKRAIDAAWQTIYTFHKRQAPSRRGAIVQTAPGVTCWQETRPIETVGLYVPGGSAPLISTAIMLGVPAFIAQCSSIVIATPPMQTGAVNPAICYIAQKIGASVVRAGGIQAIAALSIGTDTIPKVDKLFGPGNQYVMAAKQYAQNYGVAIDMPAGPSEVMVIADETANVKFVAADMLSQAEHGPDSQAVLLTTSRTLAEAIESEIAFQSKILERREAIQKSLENSLVIVFDEIASMIDFANTYAPEHVLIQCKNSGAIARKINNGGSVFLGNFSPESAGDYASGTNHTLPTNGWAKSYSGVSVSSFTKVISFQRLTKRGLKRIAPTIKVLAEAEGLTAHAQAVAIRIKEGVSL